MSHAFIGQGLRAVSFDRDNVRIVGHNRLSVQINFYVSESYTFSWRIGSYLLESQISIV
jgi:hypothetical protein